MKKCPTCSRTYADETLTYCLADGALLSAPYDPEATLHIPTRNTNPPPTEILPHRSLPVQSSPKRSNSTLVYIVVGLLALVIGGGVVALFKSGARDIQPNGSPSNTASTSPTKPVPKQTIARPISAPITSSPSCVISYSSGSCWTINPPNTPHCSGLAARSSSVTISSDGMSCTLIVPGNIAHGVRAEDSAGRQFQLHQGDEFEIESEGSVNISSDHPCASPEGIRGWYDPYVDSPFTQNVGGIEFSIGSLQSNRYFAGRYYRGRSESDGVPIFRIIDRLSGYQPNNGGAFTVTVRKL